MRRSRLLFVAGNKIDIPAVKARLAAYRHRALAATLVARRLAATEADAAALDKQLGLLHFDQVGDLLMEKVLLLGG